ncbi:MFS transporter [Aeromicrobium wangtongii]|uniref:MFS transporter n=1 Tax=Aeromicrobium wangtongii TaxID=2969247 RepID=UPI0020181F05|nr:MFS transporter [Aeromicrobium wangtongii]MCL3817193.1 MFS transporter [Aeromicrobium wangtongii]
MSTMERTTGTMDSQRAGAREWAALAVLMLPVLMTSVDNTVLTFALPAMSIDLRPTGTQLLWIVDIYAIMLAGLLIAMGSIGDRFGRRRLLVIGSIGFGVASLLAAFSGSPEMLIVARVLQGVFGAMLMPSTLSLIRNVFHDARDRRIAIATWAAMFSGGAALGPVLGGWLLGHFWWGSVYFINAPIILAFVPLALLLLPESRDPAPGPLDLPSIGLSLSTMLPLVFAIKNLAEHGLTDLTLTAFSVGMISAWALVRRLRTAPSPMIDLSLFGNRVFSGAILANLLSFMGFTGFLFLGSQLLQLVLGLSAMDAALVLLPGLAATVVAGFVAVRLLRVASARVLVTASFAASAVGYALTAMTGTPTVITVAVAFAVMGIGIGMAETLTNDLMLSSVPPSKAGAASAISETAYEIGAVLGTAVLGTILTSIYRSHLTYPAIVQWGDRNGSFETLGGTVEVAKFYPNEVGTSLLDSARGAFDLGVQYTSAAAIVIALLAALVSWRTLKHA